MANGIKLKDIDDLLVIDVKIKAYKVPEEVAEPCASYLVYFESMTSEGVISTMMEIVEQEISKYDFDTYNGQSFLAMCIHATAI